MGFATASGIAERARVYGGFEDRHEAQRRVQEWLQSRGPEDNCSIWRLVAGTAAESRESGDPIRDIVREAWYGAWLGAVEHARDLIEKSSEKDSSTSELLRQAVERGPRFPSDPNDSNADVRQLIDHAIEALRVSDSDDARRALLAARELLGR